jgi:hypothetical protein
MTDKHGVGELADPQAFKFWSSSFFTTTGSTSFPTFLERLFRFYESDERSSTLAQLCKLSTSVLLPLRRSLIGNGTEISPPQLQEAIDNSPSHNFPEAIFAEVERLGRAVKPLDEALGAIVDGTNLAEPAAVKTSLQDAGDELRNLVKLSTSHLETHFNRLGFDAADAGALAFAVFKEARSNLPIEVIERTKLVRAHDAIDNRDLDVDMHQCGLTATDVTSYVEKLIMVGVAESVDLSSNNMHAEGAANIARLVEELPSLKTLQLYGNNLQLSGIVKVLDALVQTADKASMQHIDVSECHGGPDCAAAMARAAAAVPTLRRVAISGNDIGAMGAMSLGDMLVRGGQLHEVYIASNNLGDTGIRYVADGLKENTGLTLLDVRNNRIGDDGVATLMAAVATHPSLRVVDLGDNQFSAAGVEAVLHCLAHNTLLHEVRVGSSVLRVGSDAVISVAAYGQKNAVKSSDALRCIVAVPLVEWSADQVGQWCHDHLRRPVAAAALRKSGVNGAKLAVSSLRGMEQDGVASAADRAVLMDKVSTLVGPCE